MAAGTPKIFISHIHEEVKLGSVLKSWIEDAFVNQVTVFLSSDPKDLPGGRKWLDDIQRELRDPLFRVLISLISPQSHERPWIGIELGAAWIQDKMVIPLCHSGMSKGRLGRPLGDFMAIDLDDDKSGKLLLDAIANALQLRYSSRLPVDQMRADALTACKSLKYPPTATLPQPGPELAEEEIRILQVLCRQKDADGDGDVFLTELARAASLPVARLEWRMERLIEDDFARDSYYGEGRHFSIREKGTDALIKLDRYPG